MARRRGTTGRKPWQRGQRVFVYVRVSKIGDRQDTLISDDVQEDVCRKWAEREGLVVIGEPITDLDKTGREVTKRQIAKSIQRVRDGEADGIVVWKVSRWGRNLIDSMLNVAELQEAGGFIASATENLDDIETPMGRFSLTQMLAIAQLQSDQIGETWENIHDYRRDQGAAPSGGFRLGYDCTKGEKDPTKAYIVSEVTGPWVKRCYVEFNAGRPLSKLVDLLWENGIRSRNGKRITYRALMVALDSGFAAGLLVDRRHVKGQDTNPNKAHFTAGAHPAIIDIETWEQYVRRRAEVRAPRERAAVHKLSGLAYCGSCGGKLSINYKMFPVQDWKPSHEGEIRTVENGGYRRRQDLRCWRIPANKTVTEFCKAPVNIAVETLEDHVLDWLRENYEGKDYASTALARQGRAERARADVTVIQAEMKRLKGRLSKLADMVLDAVENDDEYSVETFREKQAEIRAELESLKARHSELEVEADISEIPTTDAFGALMATWKHSDPAMLNEALRSVLCRVIVDRGKGRKRVRPIGRWDKDCPDTNRLLQLV